MWLAKDILGCKIVCCDPESPSDPVVQQAINHIAGYDWQEITLHYMFHLFDTSTPLTDPVFAGYYIRDVDTHEHDCSVCEWLQPEHLHIIHPGDDDMLTTMPCAISGIDIRRAWMYSGASLSGTHAEDCNMPFGNCGMFPCLEVGRGVVLGPINSRDTNKAVIDTMARISAKIWLHLPHDSASDANQWNQLIGLHFDGTDIDFGVDNLLQRTHVLNPIYWCDEFPDDVVLHVQRPNEVVQGYSIHCVMGFGMHNVAFNVCLAQHATRNVNLEFELAQYAASLQSPRDMQIKFSLSHHLYAGYMKQLLPPMQIKVVDKLRPFIEHIYLLSLDDMTNTCSAYGAYTGDVSYRGDCLCCFSCRVPLIWAAAILQFPNPSDPDYREMLSCHRCSRALSAQDWLYVSLNSPPSVWDAGFDYLRHELGSG